MVEKPKCQFCDNKKAPPIGMIRWPTEDDDYACAPCIRKKHTEAREAMRKVCAQCEELSAFVCDSHCPLYGLTPTAGTEE